MRFGGDQILPTLLEVFGRFWRGASRQRPLLLATVVAQINSVVVMSVVGRIGGASILGDVRLAMTAMGLATILSLQGAVVAVSRSAALGNNTARGVALARVSWAIGGGVALVATGALLLASGDDDLGFALVAGAAVFPFWAMSDVALADMIGREAFGHYMWAQVLIQAATAVGAIAAMLVAPYTPALVILVYYGVWGAIQLALLRRCPSSEPGEVTETLGYAKRLSGAGVLGTLTAEGDIVAAGALLGRSDVGSLAVARTASLAPKRLWDIIAQANIARLSRMDETECRREVGRLAGRAVAAFSLLLLVGALTLPTVVPAIFGGEFSDVVVTMDLLLAAWVLYALGAAYELHLVAQAKTRALYVVGTVRPLVSIGTLPVFLVAWGVVGVGVHAMCMAVIYSCIAWWMVRHTTSKNVPSRGVRRIGHVET